MDRLTRTHRQSPEEAVNIIQRRIAGISRSLNNDFLDETSISNFQNELNSLYRNVERLQPIVYVTTYRNILQSIASLSELVTQRLQQYHESIHNVPNTVDEPNVIEENVYLPDNQQVDDNTSHTHDSINGVDQENSHIKRLKIDKEKLESLLSLGFSVRKIAKDGLLGKAVHYNTIHSFMKDNEMISMRQRYSVMTDAVLKNVITDINSNFPNSGIREMVAHLKSRNLVVQRNRVAKLLAEVDHVGTAVRWAQVIQRRRYQVPSPNSLWHMDSHHSLVQ